MSDGEVSPQIHGIPLIVQTVEEEEGRPPFYWVLFGLVATLVVVAVTAMIYLYGYVQDLRLTQEALICQSEVTNDLRLAANFDRDAATLVRVAQVELLSNLNRDPIIGENAIKLYVEKLQAGKLLRQQGSDVRANINQCPKL